MENRKLQKDESPYATKYDRSSQGTSPAINQLLGNNAMIQRMTRENTDAFSLQHNFSEIMPPRQKVDPVIQGAKLVTWLKKIAKSSIWGSIVGMSYSLLGFLGSTSPSNKSEIGVGSLCLVINILSVIGNILGSLGMLEEKTVSQDNIESPDKVGNGVRIATGIIGATGCISAAATDLCYVISRSQQQIDEVFGIIAESMSVLKGVTGLIGTSVSTDPSTSKRIIKALKYSLDIIAGTIGTIAYIITLSDPKLGLWIFVAELCFRGLRFVISLITTLLECCTKKEEASSNISNVGMSNSSVELAASTEP